MQTLRLMQFRLRAAHFARLRCVYYRSAFGRNVPFPPSLRQSITNWERQSRKGDTPLPPDVWDTQYAAGKWAFLRNAAEAPRYGVIIACLLQYKPNGAVLDVGCGEGILFQRFCPYGDTRYLGIDLSQEAIAKAVAYRRASADFVCADAETYIPPRPFDAIVFNESAYYFNEPLTTLTRYTSFLAEAGIIIISTYLPSQRAAAILRLAKTRFAVVDEVTVGRGEKVSAVTVLTVA